MKRLATHLATISFALLCVSSAKSQWVSQSYDLNIGWNAIWLPLDCSYASVDELIAGKDITNVVRWNPLSSDIQYVTSPSQSLEQDDEWAFWPARGGLPASLSRLTGNAAYLVKSSKKQTLLLLGKPLLQAFRGNIQTGQNLTGFPVSPTASGKEKIGRFLSFDPVLEKSTVFALGGGDNIANWVKLVSSVSVIKRGMAYWIDSKDFSPYYGPVRVLSSSGAGLDFGTAGESRTLTLRNATKGSAKKSINVTLSLIPSEPAPQGQLPVTGAVPLLLKGEPDPQTGVSAFTPFAEPITRSIAPDEEVEVTFYADRGGMQPADELAYQSLLKVQDSLGLTEVIVPVRAISTSPAGIWIGEAFIGEVDTVVGENATLQKSSDVPFKQRIVLFVDQDGKPTLLQQVYVVSGHTNTVDIVAMTSKAYLAFIKANPSRQDPTNRISTSTLPLDLVVDSTSVLKPGATVAFSVPLGYTEPTNPFVHAYHPQHDNLDARFEQPLLEGQESYTISRQIELNVSATPTGTSTPSWGSDHLGGTYQETITGLRQKPIKVRGSFALTRVSGIKTLQRQYP
jgi:hypothetical protein